jgi:hypothetical protein
VERGEVVEDEDVALLPPELDALLLDDLAAAAHEVGGDLGPVSERGGAELLAVHPHHRVEPHAAVPAAREDARELPRAEDRAHAAVGEPLHVHAQRPRAPLGLGLVGGGEGVLPPAPAHGLGVVLAQRREGVAEALVVQLLHHLRELLQRALRHPEARHERRFAARRRRHLAEQDHLPRELLDLMIDRSIRKHIRSPSLATSQQRMAMDGNACLPASGTYQDHLVVVVDELLQRALVGGPDAAVDVRARRRPHVADVRPPERLDDGVELGSIAHVEAAQQQAAVGHHLGLHPLPVRLQGLHQRLVAVALAVVPGRSQDQGHLLAVDGLLALALAHEEEVGRRHCLSLSLDLCTLPSD